MAEPRIIKRYANRKLYDTQHSRYVTLEQIAAMIRNGEDVSIVDNNSKEDLTSITLAQIIFEEEKRQKSFLSLAAMRHIIQSGGESLQELASQAGARVRQVFRLDKEPAPEEAARAIPADEATASETDAARPGLREMTGGAAHVVREFLERSQQTFDEWQKRVDDRVRQVVETLAPWTLLQKELHELEERLGEMEKRLRDQDAPRDDQTEPNA